MKLYSWLWNTTWNKLVSWGTLLDYFLKYVLRIRLFLWNKAVRWLLNWSISKAPKSFNVLHSKIVDLWVAVEHMQYFRATFHILWAMAHSWSMNLFFTSPWSIRRNRLLFSYVHQWKYPNFFFRLNVIYTKFSHISVFGFGISSVCEVMKCSSLMNPPTVYWCTVMYERDIMVKKIRSQRNTVVEDIKMSCIWKEGTTFLEKC
jgi:hypothetical protein